MASSNTIGHDKSVDVALPIIIMVFMTEQSRLEIAVQFYTSQGALARAIGRAQATISKTLRNKKEPTLDIAARIHRATEGKLPMWELRPDMQDIFDAYAKADRRRRYRSRKQEQST